MVHQREQIPALGVSKGTEDEAAAMGATFLNLRRIALAISYLEVATQKYNFVPISVRMCWTASGRP